jgi:hypothetical protein
MVESAFSGPLVVYGEQPPLTGATLGVYNPGAAPSLFWAGSGILDSRYGWGPESTQPKALGFVGSTNIMTVNAIPSTASLTILASTQVPTSNTALTLASTSTTGIAVLTTSTQVFPSRNYIPANAIALDGLPGTIVYAKYPIPIGGSTLGGGVQVYDPTKALARNIRIAVNNADTGSYLVSGYDLYGYVQTESIAGTTNTAGGTLSGKKAFKFVTSVVPTGTITSTTITVGTGDVFGLPLRADSFVEMSDCIVGSTTVSVATGFTGAVTSTASSTTGDVRGTYALQTASNGSNVLGIFQSPKPNNLGTTTGLFGVTPA